MNGVAGKGIREAQRRAFEFAAYVEAKHHYDHYTLERAIMAAADLFHVSVGTVKNGWKANYRKVRRQLSFDISSEFGGRGLYHYSDAEWRDIVG